MGFVVADIASAAEGFARSLGTRWDGRIWEDPLQRAKVAFLITHETEPQIELVEPAWERSPVLRFLREKGGGLHHVCYEVRNVEDEMAGMKAGGAMIVNRPKPAVAFEGRRIAWMMAPGKLLIELLERPEPRP